MRVTSHPLTLIRVVATMAAAAAIITLPCAARAQEADPSRAAVQDLLSGATALLAENGLQLQRTAVGTLADRASHGVTVMLTAGVHYTFVGVCDDDCDDLDLVLSDARGDALAADTDPDDTPLIAFTPRRTGTYSLHVYMTSCNNEPCAYGVGVYHGRGGDTGAQTRRGSGGTTASALRGVWYI